MYKSYSHRDGDTMVTVSVETKPAIIDFANILAATEVVYDEHEHETPWNMCDGYDHRIEREHEHEGMRDSRGFVWSSGNRGRIRIVLETDNADAELLDWHRKRGASRQVARERVIVARRRTIDQLANWYENGWSWYGVTCDFEDAHDSIYGIDDEKYAETMREEVARNVAAQLEREGFTVRGKPTDDTPKFTARPVNEVLRPDGDGKYGCFYEPSPRTMTADQWRDHYRRNLALQSWGGK